MQLVLRKMNVLQQNNIKRICNPNNPYEKMIAQVYEGYEKRLLKNQSLDFDDLIMTTIRLFERVPDVLEFYQNKFQYIHVDEYQDTNNAQYKLSSNA